MIELKGDRLREMTSKDLKQVLQWRNHPDVRKNMYTYHEITETEHAHWFERTTNDPAIKHFIFEADDKPLGFVSFSQIDKQNKRAHWAFYSGSLNVKGLGSRMESLALLYAFESLNLNKLCCEVLSFNEPVVKFHQRFGFEVEGTLKEHYFRDGEAFDVVLLALFKSSWPAVKERIMNKVNNV